MGKRQRIKAVDQRRCNFSMLDHPVLDDYGAQLKPHGLATYWALVRFANTKDATCYPSHKTIATRTGMSVAQVKVSLQRLVNLGLIRITMRRPRTSIYTILDVPERPPNSQEVAINSQEVAINSQEVAIEQLPGSYELNVVERNPRNNTHPTTPQTSTSAAITPSAPISTNGVVVAPTVAIAQGDRTTTTDMATAGSMGPVSPFDAFFVAYPHHRAYQKARKVWAALAPDEALCATILEALSWQRTLTGQEALPLYPHVYLQNKGWLDARPVVAAAPLEPLDDDVDAPRCCQCGDALGLLSLRRCNRHARERIREEAQDLWNLLYHEPPANRPERLQMVLSHSHPLDVERFIAGINWEWTHTVESLAQAIEHVQWQVMVDARLARNLAETAENILAVVSAQRRYGGLNLPPMITDILERSQVPVVIDSLPWQTWTGCAESQIPTVEALVAMMHDAIGGPALVA